MRKKFAMIAVLCALAMPVAAQTTTPQISVTGQGQIAVAPDMAHITLGVVEEARTAAAAMDGMSAAMAAVMDRLTAAGIDSKDVQTGSLRLDQRYEHYDNNRREVIGYAAYADVNVRVFDLDMLGRVLDAAVRDGANQMNGLRFDVADRAPYLTQARQSAVADARAKAEVYADAAGVGLGDLQLMSEAGISNRPSPMMAEASFDMAARSVPIAAGELTISASVSMVWALDN